MNVQKILAPTDFSEASEPALRCAIDLADRFGAKVTLLHAFGLPVYPMLDGAVIPTPQTVVDLVSEVDRQLEAMRGRVHRAGVVIEARSIQGAPAEAIVNFARDERFDLIVMGTHGRSGLRRLALGSVAEYVVRTATVPVLTVHPAPGHHIQKTRSHHTECGKKTDALSVAKRPMRRFNKMSFANSVVTLGSTRPRSASSFTAAW